MYTIPKQLIDSNPGLLFPTENIQDPLRNKSPQPDIPIFNPTQTITNPIDLSIPEKEDPIIANPINPFGIQKTIPTTEDDKNISKMILRNLPNLYQDITPILPGVSPFQQKNFVTQNVSDIYAEKQKLRTETPAAYITYLFALGGIGLLTYMIYTWLHDTRAVSASLEEKVEEVRAIKEEIANNAPKQEELKIKLKDKEDDLKLEQEIVGKKVEQVTNN